MTQSGVLLDTGGHTMGLVRIHPTCSYRPSLPRRLVDGFGSCRAPRVEWATTPPPPTLPIPHPCAIPPPPGNGCQLSPPPPHAGDRGAVPSPSTQGRHEQHEVTLRLLAPPLHVASPTEGEGVLAERGRGRAGAPKTAGPDGVRHGLYATAPLSGVARPQAPSACAGEGDEGTPRNARTPTLHGHGMG